MASDTALVARLGEVLADYPDVAPRKMFGGTCFMLGGNMCVGVHRTDLILRVGAEQAAMLLRKPGVRPMDLTGKVMTGWVTVSPTAIAAKRELIAFVAYAVEFVRSLPAQKPNAVNKKR